MEENKKNNKPVLIFLLCFLILGIVFVTVFISQKNYVKKIGNKVDLLDSKIDLMLQNKDQELNINKEEDNVANNLKEYQDNQIGFSFSYPEDLVEISIANKKLENKKYFISVEVSKVNELDAPLGNNKETAQKHRAILENGIEPNIYSMDGEVVKLGNIYADKFQILSQIEVCSVMFERYLIFYKDDYRIKLIFSPKYNGEVYKNIISNNPSYFTKDTSNCGDISIWNYNEDKRSQFIQDVINRKTSSDAITWYYTFENIVKSIKIF